MKILIVEDNEKMRRTIRTCVADLVEEIFECADGAEALVIYSRHRPEWVLMDLEMPNVGGFEATKQIKSAYTDARVAVVTNHDGEDLRMAAGEAGACAFVLKEDLLALRDILVKSRGREAGSVY